MSRREIVQVVQGVAALDGAGVRLVRVLGHSNTKEFDPFLMLDSFDSTNSQDYIAGFPFHPHRGIETITYLVKGEIEHSDSLGNKGVIQSGDCQWMTAGSGIIHQEMPKASADSRMLGIQLWLNLPQKHKMATPSYQSLAAKEIPQIQEEFSIIRLIAGTYQGYAAKIQPKYVPMTMLDIDIKAGGLQMLDTSPEDNYFAFLLSGSLQWNSSFIQAKAAVRFGAGSQIQLRAGHAGARLIVCGAKPLDEPIAWAGPVVMNTQAELDTAFQELDQGQFVKHKANMP